MVTTDLSNFYHFYPSLAVVVGVKSGAETNFMTAAWHSGVSHTPPLYLVSIAPKRHTHDLILSAGEFTVNFMPMEELKITHGCGIVSGAQMDKIDRLNIPLTDSLKIASPVIASAYAAYECRLVHQYPAGDHTLFVGEVVAAHLDEGRLSERGILDPAKINLTLYQGTNTYVDADAESQRIVPRDLDELLETES